MESRSRRAGLGGLLAVLLAGSAAAGGDGVPAVAADPEDAACASAVADRVQARYDGVEHLQARFRQRTISAVMPGPEEAAGEVWFEKPGRMRWAYSEPAESLVVTDGRTMWIFDPAAAEVQVLPVSEEFLSGTVVQFLLGEGRLASAFEIEASGCGEGRVRLGLLPREPQPYERLELVVDPETGDLRETVILDLFANRTEVAFEDLRSDVPPPEGAFHFEPGPDVRVLELVPPGGASPEEGGFRQ